MLDTNIVSYALRQRPAGVLGRLRQLSPTEVCVSVITVAELRYGAARSQSSARYGRLIDTFLDRVQALPFEPNAAAVFGRIRAGLESKGTLVGLFDMLIAAQAIVADCVLVTNNVREFSRIDGLTIEDWSVEPGGS